MERLAIYVDGCNFLYGLRSLNPRYTDFKFDFVRYVRHLSQRRSLAVVRYYNASLKQHLNPRLFQEQQKLFDRLRAAGFDVILCKRQRRDDGDGSEHYQVKGDDIHLAIDMLKDAYENIYDVAILVSGDGDFAPVVRYILALGKQVENRHFLTQVSFDLLSVCTSSAPIDRRTANKFFRRDQD